METDNFTKRIRYITRYLNENGKKSYQKYSYLNWTKKEQDIFIEKCDTELVEEFYLIF